MVMVGVPQGSIHGPPLYSLGEVVAHGGLSSGFTATMTTTTTTRRWRRWWTATPTRRPNTRDWRPVVAVENRGRGTGCDRHGRARDGVSSRGAHGGDARTPSGLSRRYPGPQPAEEPGLLHRRCFLDRRLRAANVHAAHAAHAARGREGKGRTRVSSVFPMIMDQRHPSRFDPIRVTTASGYPRDPNGRKWRVFRKA